MTPVGPTFPFNFCLFRLKERIRRIIHYRTVEFWGASRACIMPNTWLKGPSMLIYTISHHSWTEWLRLSLQRKQNSTQHESSTATSSNPLSVKAWGQLYPWRKNNIGEDRDFSKNYANKGPDPATVKINCKLPTDVNESRIESLNLHVVVPRKLRSVCVNIMKTCTSWNNFYNKIKKEQIFTLNTVFITLSIFKHSSQSL